MRLTSHTIKVAVQNMRLEADRIVGEPEGPNGASASLREGADIIEALWDERDRSCAWEQNHRERE